ncbi:MAG: cysteine desulfurase [Chlamydiae bacterium CG10_big_fil_rev_8_21_14_0_10_42_34]|nr:MAG: cysteine desulfurase [Chlamydiae bacterium CG10_big_fil_rev_8_21_14_0_10_42_34]
MQRIYLDNNATTALDPRVFKAMLEDFSGPAANPSSVHWFGQRARNLLSNARNQVASFFSAKPDEIIFTSGGTESLNIFLRGLPTKGHVITTGIEHSAIFQTIQALKSQGLEVTYVPVGLWGAPLPEQIEAAIQPNTKAIVLTASNGETGVMIDLEKIASIAEKKGISLLIDAVSYVGKEPLEMHPGITALAISAHKFHGPKGIGALYLRSNLKLTPLLTGGAQEGTRRSGTENLAGILGLAEALKILSEKQTQITQSILDLRMHLEKGLLTEVPDIAINGEGPRVSNASNIAFLGVDGETLLMQLDMAGIAVSHGSACSSGALEPSRVLTTMGIDRKTARSSLRLTVGRMNTREEIDLAIDTISKIVKKLRKISA